MTEAQNRLVLCALLDRPSSAKEICKQFPGFEYNEEFSNQGPDRRMSDAFNYCDSPTRPTLLTEDIEEIRDHKNVAYILSARLNPQTAMDQCVQALSLIADLFEVGARAVKCDSSGITHGQDEWLKLAALVADPKTRPSTLYYAWVRRPVTDDPGIVYSCGMQLLGQPDIEIIGETEDDAAKLIDAVAAYTLPDKTGERLKHGQKFATSKDSPRFRVEKTICSRFEANDIFFNSNGYWSLKRKE